jgi:hypothetical protein
MDILFYLGHGTAKVSLKKKDSNERLETEATSRNK